MSLYESNHVRLGWLAGPVERLKGVLVATVPGDSDLRLQVLEHSPYTTTLILTCLFTDAGSIASRIESSSGVPEGFPGMTVRVYHDARLAEAQEWRHAPHAASHDAGAELDERWARNIVLNKWLEYCVERGYRFVPQ